MEPYSAYSKQILSKVNNLILDDDILYVLFTKNEVIIKNKVYERSEGTSWTINEKMTVESVLARVDLTNEVSKEEILKLIRENKGFRSFCFVV